MPAPERPAQAELANLIAAIERGAADLALVEEPARFVGTLEGAAPEPDRAAPPEWPRD